MCPAGRRITPTAVWMPASSRCASVRPSSQASCRDRRRVRSVRLRRTMTVSLTALGIRALLLDIEGTTTPIEFVYEVLFPYARAHAAEYVARNVDSVDVLNAIALLR